MNTEIESKERQMDELSALKAIFGTDLRDLRRSQPIGDTNQDKWSPIEVQITLKPMVSMSELNPEVYVQLDLYVKCGKKYPKVIPEEITLKNIKGLAVSVGQQLRNELYELAKSLRGEVMIFAFADHVRQCLHMHNKPPIQSFYDQMISHKTKLEIEKNLEIERKLESIRRRDELKRKELESEMQRKEMALLEESRLRRESISDSLLDNSSGDWKCCLNPEIISISFNINGFDRQIQRTKCLFHNNWNHSTEYLGIDLSNGKTFVIIEWILKYKRNHLLESNDDNSVEDIVNRISKIETFFKTKMKGLNHSNLIPYLSMQYSVESDYIVVDLLQEQINGNSLFSLGAVMKGQPFSTGLVKHYSKQILEAINGLHRHNCPHGLIKPTNVFIDTKGDIKISGYYLEKQFYDLFSDLNSIDGFDTYNSNSISSNVNRLKMKDIFDFGLLVIAVSSDWNFANDSNISYSQKRINRNNSSNDFNHMIDRCLESEENGRWTADLLLQHSFFSTNKNDWTHSYAKPNELVPTIAFTDGRPEQIEEAKNYEKNIQTKAILSSIVSSSMTSRLVNEFEVLDELGKGGFGFVYKVKNILDGRCYALKKIFINPSNQSLYDKIRREVNLLSRLNHENVVRYFTSWIETEDNLDSDLSEQSSSAKTSDYTKTQISVKSDKKLEKSKEKEENNSNSSDSELSSIEDVDFEAEEDIFGTSFLVQISHKVSNNSSDDQYVVFERSDCSETIPEEKTEMVSSNSVNKSRKEENVVRSSVRKQYMYIQMELCEKSTLRDAIDSGLYSETHRKRRLFREIVEGLVHIHEQGMIHRDLKPGNIFLDVNDHIKIGDFGLAKEIYFIKDDKAVEPQITSHQDSDKFRLTGKIGTPFYVAPELTISADINSNKIFYTQKVDIYSLGIMFFEMSYPFQTLMERTKVVMNLRKKDIVLPIDANKHLTDVEIELLNSLLQHDYTLRPSSSELLASDYLPAPEMEEKEEQNVIRRAVQNPRTKIHKYMLNMLFQKEISEIEDYVFDVNDQQFGAFVRTKSDLFSFSQKQRVFQFVYSLLESVMQSHCAVSLSLPTLIPKHSTQKYDVNDVYYVVDNNGSIVSLPHDLRVPFARYIARNKISHLRRYSIEKVYRQRRVMGYHPRELWECAFDIVTPRQNHSSHILPDAEVLSVLSHVINALPVLSTSKLTLKVNHIKLVKAILHYCDIPEDEHNKVIGLIGECHSIKMTQNIMKESNDSSVSSGSTLSLNILAQRKKILEKCIDESKINAVLLLLDLEQDSVRKLMSNLKTNMRKKGIKQQNALEMAKKALKELNLIISCAEKLGNLGKMSVRVSPSFVISGSSSTLYSGMTFQLEREVKHKKSTQKQVSNIIAVGGRYDVLLDSFDVMHKKNEKQMHPKGAVGISIEFERIMKYILDEEMKSKTILGQIIDCVVCSLTNENSDLILKELCFVTKEFWNYGIKAFSFPEDLPKNIDELHAFCLENTVRYAIALKESSDPNQSNFNIITAKLFAYEKERYVDKKVGNVSDVVDYVIRMVTALKNESNNSYNNCWNSDQTSIVKSESNKQISSQSMYTNDTNVSQTTAIGSNLSVSFYTTDKKDKLHPMIRKRHENNIISHLSTALNFVSNNTIIEVIAVDLPFKVIKTIAAEIEFDVEDETKSLIEKTKLSVIDKHLRHRKEINKIIDAIFDYKCDKKCPILCIISITDNMKFKILS